MKKSVQFLLMALMFGFFSTTFAQIMLDGDDADWAEVPLAIEAPNNEDGVFPTEVGAVVNDIVDIKEAKVHVVGNVMYGLLRFWGGPAWPNEAYQNDHDGVIYPESRGYYHFLLDLDNDVTTGWNTAWYEAHFTPVGYLQSLAVEGQDPIGAEVMHEWGGRENDAWKQLNEDKGLVRNLDHWAADYSEYDGETDLGSDYEIFNITVPNADSAKMMGWQGSAKINSSDDESLVSDQYSYFVGHAWGNDFLEFGMEWAPIQKYYAAKGLDYLNPEDVIAICGMTETPIDDWAVDMTTRGEVTLPSVMPVRQDMFTFDGDESDWAELPLLLEAPNNEDGVFPTEVGAVVNDIIDIKEVKGYVDEENVYWFLRMWGGPCWPNNAYQNDHDGVIYPEHRGHYHVLLDVDNDVTTGWNTAWYEAHFTPVGYLQSLAVEGQDPIGAEVMLEWTGRTRDDWKVENEGADPFRSLEYWAADYSEYDGETDLGSDYEIYSYNPPKDSTNMMRHDGLVLNGSTDDPTLIDGQPDWMAHAWGHDFIEMGMSLRTLRNYYVNKTGIDYFQDGQVMGICGMNETPIDDWAVDMTTRGEMTVGMVTDVAPSNELVVNKFALENNYPNPFNPETHINFSVPNTSKVSLVIYNNLGQKVRTLVNSEILSGIQTAVWNGKNDFGNSVPSGIYYYRMEAGSNSITKSMVLLK